MHPSSASYLKTTVLAASSGALVIGLTLVAARDLTGLSRALVEGAGWLVGLASGCVALAGAVTLVRSKRRAEGRRDRSEEHTSELQSQSNLVCRLLLEKKKR